MSCHIENGPRHHCGLLTDTMPPAFYLAPPVIHFVAARDWEKNKSVEKACQSIKAVVKWDFLGQMINESLERRSYLSQLTHLPPLPHLLLSPEGVVDRLARPQLPDWVFTALHLRHIAPYLPVDMIILNCRNSNDGRWLSEPPKIEDWSDGWVNWRENMARQILPGTWQQKTFRYAMEQIDATARRMIGDGCDPMSLWFSINEYHRFVCDAIRMSGKFLGGEFRDVLEREYIASLEPTQDGPTTVIIHVVCSSAEAIKNATYAPGPVIFTSEQLVELLRPRCSVCGGLF